MKIFRRYIWIGDTSKGKAVYWDAQEKKVLIGKNSKVVNAKKSKNNGSWVFLGISVLIILLAIARLFFKDEFNVKADIFSIFDIAAIITTVILLLGIMNKLIYGEKHRQEGTLKEAITALNSTGYETNQYIRKVIRKENGLFLLLILLTTPLAVWLNDNHFLKGFLFLIPFLAYGSFFLLIFNMVVGIPEVIEKLKRRGK